MPAIANPKFEAGTFVSVDPGGGGITSVVKGDGTLAVMDGWNTVTGDRTYNTVSGSAGVGSTNRHLFNNEVFVDTTGGGAYVNVRAFASITGKPTTVQGFGITNGARLDIANTFAAENISVSSIVTGQSFAASANKGVMAYAAGHTQFWSYGTGVSALGDFQWLDRSSNGSLGTNRMVLASTGLTVEAGIYPGTDATYDLGGVSQRWRAGYFNGEVVVYGQVRWAANTSLTVPGTMGRQAVTGLTMWPVAGTTNDYQVYDAAGLNAAIRIAHGETAVRFQSTIYGNEGTSGHGVIGNTSGNRSAGLVSSSSSGGAGANITLMNSSGSAGFLNWAILTNFNVNGSLEIVSSTITGADPLAAATQIPIVRIGSTGVVSLLSNGDITLGSNIALAWTNGTGGSIQTFSSLPLRLNPLGNAVTIGGGLNITGTTVATGQIQQPSTLALAATNNAIFYNIDAAGYGIYSQGGGGSGHYVQNWRDYTGMNVAQLDVPGTATYTALSLWFKDTNTVLRVAAAGAGTGPGGVGRVLVLV